MMLVPIFAISTDFGSTKNLLGFPFQVPVFFDLAKDQFQIPLEVQVGHGIGVVVIRILLLDQIPTWLVLHNRDF